MKALSIQNLKKTYANGFEALRGVDLDVETGDFFALLGPNGAGKSTLIGIISSLVNKSSGRVAILVMTWIETMPAPRVVLVWFRRKSISINSKLPVT